MRARRSEVDLEEVIESFSLFPLLLVGLAFRQGNTELFPIYFIMRLLAKINLGALATHEGRAPPMQPDQLVSQQEALLIKKTQGEVLTVLGVTLLLTWLLGVVLTGVLAWQLGGAALGLLGVADPFGAPDPLAF